MPTAEPKSWIFYDGDIRRYEEVALGVLTHGLLYGTGCFDGIRAYWNESREQLYLLQPVAHYDRLHDSARILSLELPYSTQALVDATVAILRRNELKTDTYIRSLVFKSGEGFGLPYRDVACSVALCPVPMGKYLDTDRGIRCKVSSWRRVSDDAIPVRAKVTGAYVNSHLAKLEAVDTGCDEAIMLDSSGHVSEGPGENLFMKRGDTWITPPPSSDILEGVTRRIIMELAPAELGTPVVERPIDRSELYVCDELLLCGTGAEITPVLEVDGRRVGTGEIGDATAKLQELYFAIARGENDRYADWLVPVY